MIVSGTPSQIAMDRISFEGNGNSAYTAGHTLYVVWRGVESISSKEFSSFENSSKLEGQVETWKGVIGSLAELLSGGWSVEGKNQFAVCTQLDVSGNVGKVVVMVDEVVESINGTRCVVGMEGEEVNGDVSVGEMNGKAASVDMGSELTSVMQKCEDIKIVMNVTFGESNG